MQIRREHRFESFAGETEGNDVKWCVPSSFRREALRSSRRGLTVFVSPSRRKVHLGSRLFLRAVRNHRECERDGLDPRLVAHSGAASEAAADRARRLPARPPSASQSTARGQDSHHRVQRGVRSLSSFRWALCASSEDYERVFCPASMLTSTRTGSTQTMSMSSAHTKHFLENLHENIAVMRHPDHVSIQVAERTRLV